MRHASWDEDEAASGVPFQVCGIEFRSLAQIPSPFYDGDQFVLRVSVREDAFAGGDLDTIDPGTTLTRISEQLRSLATIGVIRRSEPSHLKGGERDDLFFRRVCKRQRNCRKDENCKR